MKFNKVANGVRYAVDIMDRYNVAGVSIKIGRSTLEMIDRFLGHIIKYKRVYLSIVKYVAFVMFLGLLPDLFKWIQSVNWNAVTEYLRTDAIYEMDKLGAIMLNVMQKIGYLVMWVLVVKEVIKISYKDIGKPN